MSGIPDILRNMNLSEGYSQTILPEVRLFKTSAPSGRVPLIYNPSICFILQGAKRGYLDGFEFQYDPHTYLVVSVVTPLEMETVASPEKPLYGLSLALNLVEINRLVAIIEEAGSDFDLRDEAPQIALGPARMSFTMAEALAKLVGTLNSEADARVLGPGLIREIYYHALQEEKGGLLYKLTQYNGHFSQMIKIMSRIHENYREKLSVDELAAQAHMSVSAFHRAFKAIASESPIQYQKKIRLHKARDILLKKSLKSYQVAEEVGYESPSQFSREFKRFFGYNTAELLKTNNPIRAAAS